MSELNPVVYALLRKLRFKYHRNKDVTERDRQTLKRIDWHSIPRVYPDWAMDSRKNEYELDKMKHRRCRWMKYIRGMMHTFDDLYLVTLTFDNDTYDTDSTENRHRKAKEYLSTFPDYFACLDIGEVNGREHFHAIVAIKDELTTYITPDGKKTRYKRFKCPSREWKHGFYSIKYIKQDKNSIWRTMSYSFKAAKYAFKSSKEDNDIKPWHKRGVIHYEPLNVDEELPF